MLFKDRHDAGTRLAEALREYVPADDAVVVGLPRGGVVVAAEVARILHLPLDIIAAKKISMPDNPEFAVGAIASDGEFFLSPEVLASAAIPETYIESERNRLVQLLREKEAKLRCGKKAIPFSGKTVIIVDDGIATGATMFAAVRSAKKHGARRIIAAAPVGAPDSVRALGKEADRVVCLHTPEYFGAVGEFYESFEQTSDEEVSDILKSFQQK